MDEIKEFAAVGSTNTAFMEDLRGLNRRGEHVKVDQYFPWLTDACKTAGAVVKADIIFGSRTVNSIPLERVPTGSYSVTAVLPDNPVVLKKYNELVHLIHEVACEK